jgi:hypothetical protein
VDEYSLFLTSFLLFEKFPAKVGWSFGIVAMVGEKFWMFRDF